MLALFLTLNASTSQAQEATAYTYERARSGISRDGKRSQSSDGKIDPDDIIYGTSEYGYGYNSYYGEYYVKPGYDGKKSITTILLYIFGGLFACICFVVCLDKVDSKKKHHHHKETSDVCEEPSHLEPLFPKDDV